MKKMKNPKYIVEIYTELLIGTKFPKETYHCMTPTAIEKIISDCSKKNSEIKKIEIWINYHDKE